MIPTGVWCWILRGGERHARYHGLDNRSRRRECDLFQFSCNLGRLKCFRQHRQRGKRPLVGRQNQFPRLVRYDFGVPTEIMNYRVVAQHWQTANRLPRLGPTGINDDAAWTVLDTVTDQTGWTAWKAAITSR